MSSIILQKKKNIRKDAILYHGKTECTKQTFKTKFYNNFRIKHYLNTGN